MVNTTATTEALLYQINQNLIALSQFFWYKGKYTFVKEVIPANQQKKETVLGVDAKKLIFNADQDIKVSLNDFRNPDMELDQVDFPFILDLQPMLLVNRVFITTGANDTMVRIISFG